MIIAAAQMRNRKKRQMLLLIIFFLFLFIFVRGIQLHLKKEIDFDRIRVHAIPIALSVLYHNHPHDYTGLHAVAMQFQGGNSNLHGLISAAKRQDIGQNKENYYWVADDKGLEDYVIAAFSLFGTHVDSLYYMWFLILLTSISLFIVSFGRERWTLGFFALALLGIHVAITTLPICKIPGANLLYFSRLSLYEPRFFDVLALPAVLHIMLLAARRRSLRWIQDFLPFVGQVFILITLYHSRSSIGWELVAVVAFCFFIFSFRLFRSFLNKNSVPNRKISKIPVTVIMLLFFSLVGLNIYKHSVYNARYFFDMGNRTFWHNALMGLGQNSDFFAVKLKWTADPGYIKESLFSTGTYGVSDKAAADDVIEFSRKTKKCGPEIEKLKPQQILDSLGNHGVVNWLTYESCAKSLFLSLINENRLQAILLYGIKKPYISLHNLYEWSQVSNQHTVEMTRTRAMIGWHPFSLINLIFLLLICAFSYDAIFRARKKLIVLMLTLLICSLIPAVVFYNAVLVQGGMLVASAIFLYLILIGVLNYIFALSKKQKSQINGLEYPLKSKNLSIVIPAYNEEKNIALTLQGVLEAALKTLDDFEIIVVNDGSHDATYSIALEEATRLDSRIKIISHEINKGVGQAFQSGLAQAKFPQLCLVPGDNAFNKTGIELIFSQSGAAPLVISYRHNMNVRTPLRYFLSRVLTYFLTIITGLKIQDAHSLFLFPVAETMSLGVETAGNGYHMEILSRLLMRVKYFMEVPVALNPKPDASSGVMKTKNLLIFATNMGKLLGLRLLGRL